MAEVLYVLTLYVAVHLQLDTTKAIFSVEKNIVLPVLRIQILMVVSG
jgi:hypothetical protein